MTVVSQSIYDDTLTTPGITLAVAETLQVLRQAGIYSTNGTTADGRIGILAGGANTMTIDGMVVATMRAIYSGEGSNTVSVSATGVLAGQLGFEAEGADNTVNNAGTIDGQDRGLLLQGPSGGNTVVNSGTIRGGVTAVHLTGSGNQLTNAATGLIQSWTDGAVITEGATIVNAGTIRGFVGIELFGSSTVTNSGTIVGLDTAGFGRGILGSSATDTVINTGSIAGANGAFAVRLGDGDDIYDARGGGTTVGGVAGDEGNDRLYGGPAADALYGQSDNDTLDGGAGADLLDGYSGDDTFVLANEGNFVNTLVDLSGFDTITTTITRALTPWNFIEGLTLVDGAGGIAGYGNALNNAMIGNNSNNRLEGLGGGDTLLGMRGTDVLVGGDDSDTFKFLTVQDSVVGALRDVITDLDDFGNDIIDLSPIAGVSSYIGQAAFNAAGQVRAVQSGANVLIQINTVGATATPESEILLLNTTLGIGVGQFAGDDLLL